MAADPQLGTRKSSLPGFVRLVNLTGEARPLVVNGKTIAASVPPNDASIFIVTPSGNVEASSTGGVRFAHKLGPQDTMSLFVVPKRGGGVQATLVTGEPSRSDESAAKVALVFVSDATSPASAKLGANDYDLPPGKAVVVDSVSPGTLDFAVKLGSASAKASGKLDPGQCGTFVATDAGGKLTARFLLNGGVHAVRSGSAAGG